MRGKKLGTGVKKYLNVPKQSKRRIVDDVAVNVMFSPPVNNNPPLSFLSWVYSPAFSARCNVGHKMALTCKQRKAQRH